ncbi:MAG: translation initiation factor IF-2 subunit beta [Candidatus Micrarchaeota archaeon]
MEYNYDALLDNIYAKLPKKNLNSGERFECPLVETILQGNKTIVKNFDAACAKLRRTPVEVGKYLSKELAVPSESQQGGRLLLHGKFRDRQVNEKIADYCKTHVLCSQCSKPDTHIEDTGDRYVKVLKCEACGAVNNVRS